MTYCEKIHYLLPKYTTCWANKHLCVKSTTYVKNVPRFEKYTTCVVKIILRPWCFGQLTVAKALRHEQGGRKK